MAAGKINLQKASGGITAITGVDGTGNTQLVLPESGTVATTAGATEISTGLVELATTAETQAGTDNTKAITPLKLKNSVIGLGQTWQDVTANRTAGTTYTNSTGKPILVSYTSHSTALIFINGVEIAKTFTGTVYASYSFIVPDGSTYKITDGGMGTHWMELR